MLVRKLLKFFEKSLGEVKGNNEDLNASLANLTSSFKQSEPPVGEVKFNLEIESAIALKHPLNDMIELNPYVTLLWPFDQKQAPIETAVMNRSNYPAWHYKKEGLKIRLSKENVSLLGSQPLEFLVKHRTLSREQTVDEVIGIASVDLSSLLYVEGKKEISGYFHVFAHSDMEQVKDFET